jgi:hypothetical protein
VNTPPDADMDAALTLLAGTLGPLVIVADHRRSRCAARGCKEPARDCGDGTYCQRHAKMIGATWPEAAA